MENTVAKITELSAPMKSTGLRLSFAVGFGFDFGGGGHSVAVNSAKKVKHVVAHVAISYQAVKTSTPNSLCKLHVVGFSRRAPQASLVSP